LFLQQIGILDVRFDCLYIDSMMMIRGGFGLVDCVWCLRPLTDEQKSSQITVWLCVCIEWSWYFCYVYFCWALL